METGTHKKSLIFGLSAFLLLTLALFSVVHHMDRNIFSALSRVSPGAVLLLIFLGCAYQFMDANISRCIFGDKVPHYSLPNALSVTYLGLFGNIATSAAGTTPMMSYYLCRHGLMAGKAVSLLTVQFIFHKFSILFYATLFLVTQWGFIRRNLSTMAPYLLLGYGISLVIIGALVLICSWEKIRDLALKALNLLPDKGKLSQYREVWSRNLEALYAQSQEILRDRSRCRKLLMLDGIKLMILYTIPYVSIRILGNLPVSLWEVQALSSLMLLISNSLPNIAGMGATEFSFLLIFSGIFGSDAPAALVLHRLATYYFPFFLSCIWVVLIHRELRKAPAAGVSGF